jgi:hypothetical protein
MVDRAWGNSNVALTDYGPCGLKGFETVWDVKKEQ